MSTRRDNLIKTGGIPNLPHSPQRYAHQLGNHPNLQAALECIEPMSYQNASDFLRRFKLNISDSTYIRLFLDNIDKNTLVNLLEHPPISNTVFTILYSMNLLPLPEIMSFVTANQSEREIRKGLDALISEMHSGSFDPSIPLHLEIEYSLYRINYKPLMNTTLPSDMPFGEFKNLPEINEEEILILEREYSVVQSLAQEAAAVFHMIREKQANAKVPLLVIANRRYGDQFVISPIEDYLNDIGIKVVYERVPSTIFDHTNHISADLSQSTLNWIREYDPDIVVVDGTCNNVINGSTRFPAAMWGYINDFPGYKVCFWAPELTEEIYVGDYPYTFQFPQSKPRELLLVRSTLNLDRPNSSGGRFDDAERYVEFAEPRLVFTPKGLGHSKIARDEDHFVASIQEIMKKELQKYI
jgi:hypothetical protein